MTNPDPFAPLLDESEFERNINIRIMRLASSLSTIMQRSTLREKNVNIQEYRLLVSIARHGGGHVRDLSRKASMDAAHASRTLKSMHTKGWLIRGPHPNDKRLTMFAMSDVGRDIFMSIYPDVEAMAKEFFNLYNEEDAVQMRDMLDIAREHAAKILDEQDS